MTEDPSFWNTIERGGKTFWFFKSYKDRSVAFRKALQLRKEGKQVFMVTKAGVDALYTYPQKRWGLS